WDGGRALAVSATDGTFALDELPPTCSIGALASGFAPSALVDLEIVDKSTSPARVELRLLPDGGDLTGRVTDQDGAPIAGATVAIGDRSKSPDYHGERVVEVWGICTVETDADGHYTFVGAKAGINVVTARGPGFGIWRGHARIEAGATTTLDIELARSATLFGKVTDKDGNAEAEVRVSAFDGEPGTTFLAGGQIDYDEPFGRVETRTAGDGSYRLEGVTPGKAWLFAQRQGARFGGTSAAYLRETLELSPGAEVRWDPVIDVGRSIAGVVRYRDGYPIPHLFITLRHDGTGAEATLNSGREGEFRFLCLEGGSYEIRVQPPFGAPRGTEFAKRTGIVPDRGPVEMTFDFDKPQQEVPGTVSGRVDDAGGRIRNPENVTVTLNSDAGWFRTGIKVENGAFRAEDIKPCRFRLVLEEGGTVLASTDWFELKAAADVDVGALVTEPGGALHLRVARGASAAEFEPKFYLRRDGDPRSTTVEPGRRDDVLVESLTPGEYEVSGHQKGMVRVKAKATVRVGETSELALELQRGAVGKIEVWWPESHPTSEQRAYRVTDAAGKCVQEYDGKLHSMPTRPYPLSYTLPAGSYHLEFTTDDGLRGELDFTIPSGLEPPELRLDLH
ncbi:MAG: carboxypeptidase regulatory-like domain-containing protein, partial [Planctomycetes bacterium]|nr:carboxypeptidase regulatory-like domain-containing protein [Planctomycetota bacterium]